jgi:hypothetical protein
VDKWWQEQRRVIFVLREEYFYVLSTLNVWCKVIFIPRPTTLDKWVWREGRRCCSCEREREVQELTSECVLTTPSRSLDHKHCIPRQSAWHVHRRAQWNCMSSCSVVIPKKHLCQTIWLTFVFVHTRSYVWMTYKNVSGSFKFETPSCFRNVHTRHGLVCHGKEGRNSLVTQVLI